MKFLTKVLNMSAERYLKTAGDLFIYEGDYASALHMVEKTLEIEPGDLRALVLRGDILYCLNRDSEALDTFNQALAINPASVEALISSAGVLDVLGKYREGLDCCARAFDQMKPYQSYLLPSLYDQNVLLLLRLKKYRQARALISQAKSCLEKEDYQYLLASYSQLLDRLSESRRNARVKACRLKLEVIPGSVPENGDL